MHEWLIATLIRGPRDSPIARAIGYALTRWSALVRYRGDGRFEIQNNAARNRAQKQAPGAPLI